MVHFEQGLGDVWQVAGVTPSAAQAPSPTTSTSSPSIPFDIPDSFRRHALAGFPRSPREMWVWKRASRNLLLAADPKARYEKHEARGCSRCGRWCLGLQAQMMREREQYARTNNRLGLQSWFPNQPDSLSIHPDRPVPPSL